MVVQLRQSRHLTSSDPEIPWFAVMADRRPNLDDRQRIRGIARRLERALEDRADEWRAIARNVQTGRSGWLSQAASCNPSLSDFGATLAWHSLVTEFAATPQPVLAVCDDPWLYRALGSIDGVRAEHPPTLFWQNLWLSVRGYAARARAAVRYGFWCLKLKRRAAGFQRGQNAILVYGHPDSDSSGQDAYFSDIMRDLPGLARVFHVDCKLPAFMSFAPDPASYSMHGWGRLGFLLSLPFRKWRPGRHRNADAVDWLIARAAAREGSGGVAAAVAWECHCHGRWLRAAQPKTVAWPWENHLWERDFVRVARKNKVRTFGYQHTTVGPHMWNASPDTNPDGLDTVPDKVIANSPAHADDIGHHGIARERIIIGGARRFSKPRKIHFDPAGPVFVALPSSLSAARQLLRAVERIARDFEDWRFLVKEHPLYPLPFEDCERLRRTIEPLQCQPSVAAVIYCASTVGIEAALGGIPTLRFLDERRPAMNIAPSGLFIPAADDDDLADRLRNLQLPDSVPSWDSVFAPVDRTVWKQVFQEDVR